MADQSRSDTRQLLLELVSASDSGRPDAPSNYPDPLPGLVGEARARLAALGLSRLTFEAAWNPRMRSCAGRAYWRPSPRIELNPLLRGLPDDETGRTFWHELAHLIAHARAGRRRIRPHGTEWRRACADLGVPDESATHRLPLPRRVARRRFLYGCPRCGALLRRVRPLRGRVACRECCRIHNRGQFDPRFQFLRLPTTAAEDCPAAPETNP